MKILLTLFVLLFSTSVSSLVWGAETYGDCILKNMKNIESDLAAKAIIDACKGKHKNTISSEDEDNKTVCVETDAQDRDGIIYLPNKTKPFTGNNLCEYESGQYKSKGKYKDGKKNDVWTEWEKNGQIKFERTYYKGNEIGKDGSVITRNANDQITLKEYYKYDNLVGTTEYSYNRDNGRKSREEHNEYGSIVYLEYWWDNGHRMSREDWDKISETEWTHKQTRWYDNGKKMEEFGRKNGKKDGLFIGWYKSGQLKGESFYKDGKKDGKFKFIYESGVVQAEATFKDDQCISGNCIFFKEW